MVKLGTCESIARVLIPKVKQLLVILTWNLRPCSAELWFCTSVLYRYLCVMKRGNWSPVLTVWLRCFRTGLGSGSCSRRSGSNMICQALEPEDPVAQVLKGSQVPIESDLEKSRDGILGHQFDKHTRVVFSMLFSLFWRVLQKTNTLLWLLKSIVHTKN